MRKIFILLISAILTLSICVSGCGNLNKQTDESEEPTEHTEHIFNKGECECGEIDLTYNTEGSRAL